MKNKVVVKTDYDGFFEREAQRIADALPQKGIQIVVTAGPYRLYSVHYDASEKGIIKIDWYAASRRGFGDGPYTDEVLNDLKEIVKDW